jgi:hypothetical protein
MKYTRAWIALTLILITIFATNFSKKDAPSDLALLSIIKNDQNSFRQFILSGGSLDQSVLIGKSAVTLGSLLVDYERVEFLKLLLNLKNKELIFLREDKIWTSAISKDNEDLLKTMLSLLPNQYIKKKKIGQKKSSLMHLASVNCSHKILNILEQEGFNWADEDASGASALTLAAEMNCLESLDYWKKNKANFSQHDRRGLSALEILKKKKNAALAAFASSLTAPTRIVAVVAKTERPHSFYKKRHFPKDQLTERTSFLGPEVRPLEANDTAEYSEFSD